MENLLLAIYWETRYQIYRIGLEWLGALELCLDRRTYRCVAPYEHFDVS